MHIYKMIYASPVGHLTLTSNDHFLLSVTFGKSEECSSELPNIPAIKLAVQWLDAYFAGTPSTLENLPLDPKGTDFQKICWQELLQIPYGETVTYRELANRIAKRMNLARMSCQAVGQAIGKNPIAIIIPCHRVVGSDGKLTGYAWGLETKQQLLYHEK